VAAHERGVNRTVLKLLKGYLARSGWLYAFVGVLQFLMTEFYWAKRYDRVPAVGVILGVWGAAAALNHRSLVWRSLPLNSRDAGLFRWWAIAGVPGIYLVLLTFISWASQHSSGFPTPGDAAIFEGILASWSVLGILAALSRAPDWSRKKSRPAKFIGAMVGAALLVYGVPVGSAVRPYSMTFVGAGLILLFTSAARARGAMDWRWLDLADRAPHSSHQQASSWPKQRLGLSAILIPLAQRTAIFTAVATVIMVSLQQLFPRASVWLFWVYFIGLSSAGFLMTYRVRRALLPLRCLPLSAKQLAGLLQLLGALPGLATLGLTLLINRIVLDAGVNIGLVANFALVIIAFQSFPQLQTKMPHRNRFLEHWMPIYQRIFVPAYLGVMAASWNDAYGRFTWMRWPLQAAGVVLCIIGYFVLVQQLRAGIRPSSNENAFS
jgi:hypothetical protein